MNIEELRKSIGQLFRLHPVPVSVQGLLPEIGLLTSDGPEQKERLVDADYDWRLENVTSAGVVLHCIYTNHTVALRPEYVREHRQPNMLLLWCRLTLQGPRVRVQPL